MSPLLGCIADDYTGATDLASALVRSGVRVVQWFGLPQTGELAALSNDADAVVIALKTRSAPAADAVEMSLAALHALRQIGVTRSYFKYCSTFDSTDRGNIGPVAEALLDALRGDRTVFCPALPENGRTLCHGHLFVHGRLLNESGMERHPLTPMTDPDLTRVLARQVTRKVGLVDYRTVEQGPGAIQEAMSALAGTGVTLILTDALGDEHLRSIAVAVADWPLATGGSGLASALPQAYRRAGLLPERPASAELPRVAGPAAVISGSCSAATQRQLVAFGQRHPMFSIDAAAVALGATLIEQAVAWAAGHIGREPFAIHAAPPHEASRATTEIAAAMECTLATIARRLVEVGVRRLVVAGGETSGAVVQKLGVRAVRIGAAIDPGVPWTETLGEPRLALALKSGNFGSDNFFLKALEILP